MGDKAPPQSMWMDDDALVSWFEAVQSGNTPTDNRDTYDEEFDLSDTGDPMVALIKEKLK